MTKFGWAIVLAAVLIIGGATAFFFMRPAAPLPPPAATGNENLEGKSLYANGEYGFTLQYPSTAKENDVFSTSYILAQEWRAEAPVNSTGTPVAEIVGYHTESDHSFPRSFTAMVRVGVATSSADVASCEKATTDTGETTLPDVVINGTAWKAFGFQDAATMHYVKGISYRAVHDGKCYAMEKLATGSSYMDDPDSLDDIPQDKLDAAYAALDVIVSSFAFTNP